MANEKAAINTGKLIASSGFASDSSDVIDLVLDRERAIWGVQYYDAGIDVTFEQMYKIIDTPTGAIDWRINRGMTIRIGVDDDMMSIRAIDLEEKRYHARLGINVGIFIGLMAADVVMIRSKS